MGKILLTFTEEVLATAILNKHKLQPSSLPPFYALKWTRAVEYKAFRKHAALYGGNIAVSAVTTLL